MNIPTFPLRPVNGGPLDRALPKTGKWRFEPKYNGWRSLVHIATGTMFNRHGKLLSIQDEFTGALDALRTTLDADAFKWADVEALERRHGIGRGCLLVLDVLPEPACAQATCAERRRWLDAVLPELDLAPPGHFPLLSIPPAIYGTLEAWRDLQLINQRLGCPFYEGMVAKREDSLYPRQLRSPDLEFPFWLKHRWAF
jgi:ATP-dependent DNA ligase